MKRISRCDLLALASTFGLIQVAACAPETGLRQQGAPVVAEAVKVQKSTANETRAKGEASFEGDWAYRTDCDRGHYVTLSLSADKSGLTGTWSDGTQLGGSQGRLRGRIEDGKLIADWCGDDEEAGGYPKCPNYAKSEDYFVLRDQSLHWYRKSGARFAQYVVVKKGADGQRPDAACE
jgi:hypothetical protein